MSKQKTESGLIIMSTFPDQELILKIAKHFIVEKKLCGCISWTKVRSLFFWKNDLEDQEEFLVLFKTTKLHVEKLKSEIKKVHPYEVPEIIEIKMNDVSKSYLSWLIQSTK